MRDHDEVRAAIDRIVAGARLPSRDARDDLRRELWTHFEEAAPTPDAAALALCRFGTEALVAGSFRRIYRLEYTAVCLMRVAASLAISMAAAVTIQLAANLRVPFAAGAWLSPGFPPRVALSAAVVLGLVIASEITRRPFSVARAAWAIAAYAAVWTAAEAWMTIGPGPFVMATVLVAIGRACAMFESWPRRASLLAGGLAAGVLLAHARVRVHFCPPPGAAAPRAASSPPI